MNARAAKLVRRVAAKLTPAGHSEELERGLKRMWYRAGRRGRHGLRVHFNLVLAARPEDVAQVFGTRLK